MDKLKDIGPFLWTHRFWFSLGLAVLIGFFVIPSGAQKLQVQAKQKQAQLEAAYNKLGGYRPGHPNPRWIAAAKKEHEGLRGDVDAAWEQIYLEQEKRMTWPDSVADVFAGRAFGDDLSDRASRFLTEYWQDYNFNRRNLKQVTDLYLLLNPLREEDGAIKGVVEVEVGDPRNSVLKFARWGNRFPSSLEAWLAQEEIWVQRALFGAIAEANSGAKNWIEAPIRKLARLEIGEPAVDSSLAGDKKKPDIDDPFEKAQNKSARSDGQLGVDSRRYLRSNEKRYRTVPVFLSMLVDQKQIPHILCSLSNAELLFAIREVRFGVPASPVEVPDLVRDSYDASTGPSLQAAVFDTVQLDVWGQLRIYEMPQSLKDQRAKAAKEAAENKDKADEPAEGDAP